MSVAALVVAAGKGLRLGSSVPKQFLPLAGKPLINHCLERFLDHPEINHLQLVIDLDERQRFEGLLAHPKMCKPVAGGKTRQESVYNGLRALQDTSPDHVLIHDGARPMLSNRLIDTLLEALGDCKAVLPVLKVADTLKEIEGNRVTGDRNRDLLVRAQTPQAFDFDMILNAHMNTGDKSFTDDAGIALDAGFEVKIIAGEDANYKVTEAADLARAERELGGQPLSEQRRWRSAQGYDVHRLVEGRPLILCGVTIPFERGLDGHSDADAPMHALTDAILGLIADGDIGSHFPPSDPQWKDASSDRFLIHSHELLKAKGGVLEHVDITIICEAPKIGPHRDAMAACLGKLLTLEDDQISIKATTNEKLGFLGRGEGIAALASATASMPPRGL